jgi:hypothetical protein
MNVSTQLFGLVHTASNDGNSFIMVGEPTIPHETVTEKHLTIEDAATIYGGHSNLHKLSDQVQHTDFAGDPKRGKITKNKDLVGKQTPGSIVYPLIDERSLYIMQGDTNKQDVTAKLNDALFFSGDVVHGGKTTKQPKRDQKLLLHPSLHVYLRSSNHQTSKEGFTLDTDAIANVNPELLPLVHASEQVASVKKIGNRFVAASEAAMSNAGGNKQMSNVVRKTAISLVDLLDEEEQRQLIQTLNNNLNLNKKRKGN